MKHQLAHAQRWLAKQKAMKRTKLYPLEKWEAAAIAKLPLDERIAQLREAMEALDAMKPRNPTRKKLEADIYRAARGVLLPLRKDNPLSNPTTPAPVDEAGKLAVSIRAGRVVFVPGIGAFECVSQEQALAAIQAVNVHGEQSDSARLAIEADAPEILKDATPAPSNPWQQPQ